MKSLRIALLFALALGTSALPASAWPYIDVTASEVVSVDPPRVRTTFEISFVGYSSGYTGQEFIVTPLDPATVHIFECAGPPLWVCFGPGPPSSGGVLFSSTSGTGAPYAPVNTFSIVTEQSAPCMRFIFLDGLLGGSPTPTLDSNYSVEACLVVDAPVPARPASWGTVKSIYR